MNSMDKINDKDNTLLMCVPDNFNISAINLESNIHSHIRCYFDIKSNFDKFSHI